MQQRVSCDEKGGSAIQQRVGLLPFSLETSSKQNQTTQLWVLKKRFQLPIAGHCLHVRLVLSGNLKLVQWILRLMNRGCKLLRNHVAWEIKATAQNHKWLETVASSNESLNAMQSSHAGKFVGWLKRSRFCHLDLYLLVKWPNLSACSTGGYILFHMNSWCWLPTKKTKRRHVAWILSE